MATPEDLQANADYIRMADQYVEVSLELSIRGSSRRDKHRTMLCGGTNRR